MTDYSYSLRREAKRWHDTTVQFATKGLCEDAAAMSNQQVLLHVQALRVLYLSGWNSRRKTQ